MEADFSFERLLAILRRKYKLFLIVGLVAIVAAMVFSSPYFITPRYKSEAVVYPANLIPYSIESETEQLLQLFRSSDVRDSIIQRFNLIDHYGIDTTSRGYRHRLKQEFEDRIKISKTNLESVLIEVSDEDPILARDIVDQIIHQLNYKARQLQRSKTREVLTIAQERMNLQKSKLDSIERQLEKLSVEDGILHYEAQSEELTEAYYEILAKGGRSKDLEDVSNQLEKLRAKGGQFRALTELGDKARENYSGLVVAYQNALNDLTKELTYTNVVVLPDVPDQKSYPVRWVIVVITFLSSLLFTAIVLVAWDKK